ncbi:hypothetical protein AAE478_000911 [Parahypoxylon ruwenzoriense]
MPHPFHPDDFPIKENHVLNPTLVFYLKGCIHSKTTAQILDVTNSARAALASSGGEFSQALLSEAAQAAHRQQNSPAYEIKSSGNIMRTLKTVTDGRTGSKVCDLNMTFISFDSSTVRFPRDSPHSRHDVELWPVGDRASDDAKHEAFVRHSIPYFWDMTRGPVGVLYKCLNQQRVEIGRVACYGPEKDALLLLDGDELDDVVAISTCIILLNGRDAIDS